MLRELKLKAINYSVRKIRELDETSLTYQAKRGFFLIPMVWWGGAMDPQVQRDYTEITGFKREQARYFTLANAAWGFVTATLWYYGGERILDTGDSANLLELAANAFNIGYNVAWIPLQNVRRIYQVIKTGEPQISLSITGLVGSPILKRVGDAIRSIGGRRLEKIVQESIAE